MGGWLIPNTRVQFIAEAAQLGDSDYQENAQVYCRDLLLHIHGLYRRVREAENLAELRSKLLRLAEERSIHLAMINRALEQTNCQPSVEANDG